MTRVRHQRSNASSDMRPAHCLLGAWICSSSRSLTLIGPRTWWRGRAASARNLKGRLFHICNNIVGRLSLTAEFLGF
jgi:hypothetical protein